MSIFLTPEQELPEGVTVEQVFANSTYQGKWSDRGPRLLLSWDARALPA